MKKKNILLIPAIVLIACCLRSPLTGVGPLVSTIRGALDLSGTAAGLLTTIPLLAFALVSVFVGKLSARFGAGRLILSALIVLIIGIFCRSLLGTAGLFVGTIIIGLGLGVNNVMLPAIIKSEFPDRIGPMTSVYSTVFSTFASISSAVSVPIAMAYSWKTALVVWIVFAVLALIFWFPSRKSRLSVAPQEHAQKKRRSVARDPMTWFITVFMGLQSLLFYCLVAWFATILQAKGYSVRTAGYLNSGMMLIGIPGSFLMPIIASRTKHQARWGGIIGAIFVVGLLSIIQADKIPFLIIAMVCCGFSTGSCIAFIMALISLHTKDAQDASELSGLSQSIGYLLAAVGPILMGKIFDATQNWTLQLIILAAIGVVTGIFGWLSGQNRIINADD